MTESVLLALAGEPIASTPEQYCIFRTYLTLVGNNPTEVKLTRHTPGQQLEDGFAFPDKTIYLRQEPDPYN